MNRALSTVLVVLLLCACKPAQPPAPAAPSATASSAQLAIDTAAATDAAASGGVDAVNQAIDQLLGDHARYQTAIQSFQKAVAGGDKQAVAALVDYPINVVIDSKPHAVKDAASFVADYDRFMTPAIVKAIREQKYQNLFVNAKGVMFGSGEAWINGVCRDSACQEFDVKVVALQPTAN